MKTPLLATLALAGLSCMPAEAALLNAFILDTFSSPANASLTPFTFTSNDGYTMNLNGSQIATSLSALPGGQVTAQINAPLTYHSDIGTIDNNEWSATAQFPTFASYVNSEIKKLDDVGFFQEGPTDAPLNVDYGNNASVLFNIPQTGLSHLLIAEDAGLDPFKLEHCTGVNSGCSLLFNGWTTSGGGNVQSTLTSNGFGLNDTPNDIDQAFLFVFDAPLTGYFRLTETDNPDYHNSTKLEIDFIGGVTGSVVPEPGSLLMTGLGMAGLLWMARRRNRARADAGIEQS